MLRTGCEKCARDCPLTSRCMQTLPALARAAHCIQFRLVSVRPAGLIAVAVLSAFAAGAAGAQDTVFVTMRGLAYDSLRGIPLAGAFVALTGTRRSAVSDARGRFHFDSVPAGQHSITMQHDVLDSIGFSGRSARVSVDATHRDVTVAVPSFATLWRGLCGGPAPRDSGIVYGLVRDPSGQPTQKALVGITWKDVSQDRRTGLDLKDVRVRVPTDSTGRYVFCGVPIGVGMQLAASEGSMATGAVDVAPLTLRVARRDLHLSVRAAP